VTQSVSILLEISCKGQGIVYGAVAVMASGRLGHMLMHIEVPLGSDSILASVLYTSPDS
jgi:hypothetical protein